MIEMSDSDDYDLYPNAGIRYIKKRDEYNNEGKVVEIIDLVDGDDKFNNVLENRSCTTWPLPPGHSNSLKNSNKDMLENSDSGEQTFYPNPGKDCTKNDGLNAKAGKVVEIIDLVGDDKFNNVLEIENQSYTTWPLPGHSTSLKNSNKDMNENSVTGEQKLYPNPGKGYIKNRDKRKANAGKVVEIIDIVSDGDIENEDLIARPLYGQSNLNDFDYSRSAISDEYISEDDIPLAELCKRLGKRKRNAISDEYISEDDIPLAELCKRLGKRKRNRSPSPTERKIQKKNSRGQNNGQSSASQVRNLGVIVFDDDTGYPTNTLPPIDFNSGYHKQNRQSNILEDKSLDSITNENSEKDDFFVNHPTTILVQWNNNKNTTVKEFKLHRYQTFESIFDELAKMENITTNRVRLMCNLKSVNPMDTPSSLNVTFFGAVRGSISATEINWNRVNLDNENYIDTTRPKESGIQVKLLLQSKSKKKLLFTVLKHQKMDVLYTKCAEEINCVKSKLKLFFDGEHVEPMELVSDLCIEDGDIFDVHVKD